MPSAVDPRIGAWCSCRPTRCRPSSPGGCCPAEVPHADAAADAGRTALLVAALAGQPEHLLRATRDFLHQEYRRPAMPASLALVDALRADGVPAIVSGAGPTVLAFTDAADAPAQAARGALPGGLGGRTSSTSTPTGVAPAPDTRCRRPLPQFLRPGANLTVRR